MVEKRNCLNKKKFIQYLKNIGIDVRNNTKARGHAGFCLGNRIDVDKNLNNEEAFRVLLHEFAHYVHFKIEPTLISNGGSLKILFDTENIKNIEEELFNLSLKVFDSRILLKIGNMKREVKEKIEEQKKIIKNFYPKFKISEKFREFNKYIKHSEAKYLLKYDRVLIKKFWFLKDRLISVNSLYKDFPEMPEAFSAYIILKSLERKRKRLNARNYKINKYLKKPTELFARFIQSYYLNYELTKSIAPETVDLFEYLKNKNYYPYLNETDFILLVNDYAATEQ